MASATVACVAALIERHLHDAPRMDPTCAAQPELEAIRPRLAL